MWSFVFLRAFIYLGSRVFLSSKDDFSVLRALALWALDLWNLAFLSSHDDFSVWNFEKKKKKKRFIWCLRILSYSGSWFEIPLIRDPPWNSSELTGEAQSSDV